PFFSGLFTFLIFVIGRTMPEIELLLKKDQSSWVWPLLKASTILPNLSYFNLTSRILHQNTLPATYLVSSILYCFCYLGMFLLLSIFFFKQRDFV
ncbi:MAG: hypothetical protein AAGJ35_10970, partial [Myxococcota bacterium]